MRSISKYDVFGNLVVLENKTIIHRSVIIDFCTKESALAEFKRLTQKFPRDAYPPKFGAKR